MAFGKATNRDKTVHCRLLHPDLCHPFTRSSSYHNPAPRLHPARRSPLIRCERTSTTPRPTTSLLLHITFIYTPTTNPPLSRVRGAAECGSRALCLLVVLLVLGRHAIRPSAAAATASQRLLLWSSSDEDERSADIGIGTEESFREKRPGYKELQQRTIIRECHFRITDMI
jgi:hypothetical protein